MNTPRESTEMLKMLVAGLGPEDEARLALAYEKFGKGDPDSLPSLFTLMDMFSLRCHASLLEEQQRMLANFSDVAGKLPTKAVAEPPAKAAQNPSGSPVLPLLIGTLLGGAAMFWYAGNLGGIESKLKQQGATIESKVTTNARKQPVLMLEIKSPGGRAEAYTSATGSAVTVISIRK